MAIKKNAKAEENFEYDVKVLKAKDFTKGDTTTIAIDLLVNGVTIYGCWYRSGTNKKDKEYSMVTFPSHKGNDDKYYNHVYFKINDDILSDIEKQIEALI